MALWPVIQPLFVLFVFILLISQWIYPLWKNQPLFPWFRKLRKKKVLEIIEEKKEEMSAEKALDLVNFHSTKALHFIAVAESYAEGDEKEAKEKLQRALTTLESVRERAQKIKDINPKEEGFK